MLFAVAHAIIFQLERGHWTGYSELLAALLASESSADLSEAAVRAEVAAAASHDGFGALANIRDGHRQP